MSEKKVNSCIQEYFKKNTEQKEVIQGYQFYPYIQKTLQEEIKNQTKEEIEYYEFLLLIDCTYDNVNIVNFNITLSHWIKTIIYNRNYLNYITLLDRLEKIANLIDDNMMNTLWSIVKDEKVNSWIRAYVAKTILSIDNDIDNFIEKIEDKEIVTMALLKIEKNSKVINILIEIFKEAKISFYYMMKIAKVLSKIEGDNQIINILVKTIRDGKIRDYYISEIVETLLNIKKDDNQIENTLIEVVKDKEIDFKIRFGISKALLKIRGDNKEIVDILIELIEYGDIRNWDKREIARNLSIRKKSDKEVAILMGIIRDKELDSHFRGEMVEILLTIERDDNEFVDTLIEVIKDKEIYAVYKNEIVRVLLNIKRDDDKFVDVLIEIIRDKKMDLQYLEWKITEKLSKIKRDDNKIINAFIEIIQDKKTNSRCREIIIDALSKLTSEDITILKRINISEYSESLITHYSIDFLFKAYDSGYISLEEVIKSAFYSFLPLFVKNNRLCTVYKKQVIETQREI